MYDPVKARPKSWRDVLPVHPAAELFPMMSEAELRELGEDIKKNGLKSDIILWSPGTRGGKGKKRFVLDGRNRLDAMELVGASELTDILNLLRSSPFGSGGCWYCHLYENDGDGPIDPYAYVLSANIQRRHLTAEQRRELIAKVLKAKPELSNNAIAKQVKADDKTVAKVRTELVANSDIPNKTERTESDGRRARGRKPKAEQKVFDSPQEAHSQKSDDAQIEADKAEVRELWSKVQAAGAGVSESLLDNMTNWLKCIGRHAESHAKFMLDSDWSGVTLADCKAMLKLLDEAQEPIHRIRAKVQARKAALKTRSILEKSDPDLVAEIDAKIAGNDDLGIPAFLQREAAE